LFVYIVRITGPAAAFRSRLSTLDGATFVRRLPPDRVVVTLPSPADVHRLAALDGVESVIPDRLERPR
jgi:hypothetical protein